MRNACLLELCRQVEMGKLTAPFDEPPSETALLSFSDKYVPTKSQSQECGNSSSWSDLSSDDDDDEQWHTLKCTDKNLTTLYGSQCPAKKTDCVQFRHNFLSENGTKVYKQTLKTHLCDHQDNLTQGHNLRQKKHGLHGTAKSFPPIIKALQEENYFLKQEVNRYKNLVSAGNTDTNTSLKNIYEEITSLKTKLTELEQSKASLETRHQEVITQYQTDMDAKIMKLSERLQQSQNKNHKLEESVQSLTQQLEILQQSQNKNHKLEESVKTLTQRLEILQQSQNKNHKLEESVQSLMQRLEILEAEQASINSQWSNRLQTETLAFQETLTEIEKKYCTEVQNQHKTIVSLNKQLSVKSTEILQLECVMKEQSSNMQREVAIIRKELEENTETTRQHYDKTITFLQKAVTHNEMYKSKIKHFERKLLYLEERHQIEMEELQLKMKSKHAQLVVTMGEEKQRELETLTTKLEERYRALLRDIQAKAARRHQEDKQKIEKLEAQLAKINALLT
ncbi:putative leucine-rich repeat-containing protein DDB_G0290503 [Periplaneta americana]|uniref:putative leucine-rich repeat-containing protein DDB_G0290503 n=1 Tax=Periplaneta americana TaxID=6978 RepID=UPI0037E80AC4